MSYTDNFKRKNNSAPVGARSLQERVNEMGGQTGYALELDPTRAPPAVSRSQEHRTGGIYGERISAHSSLRRARLFQTPGNNKVSGTASQNNQTPAAFSVSNTSRASRFSRASSQPNRSNTTAVHIVCAISENLARETCVSSLDAGSPTTLQVTKQGNGQTYAETIAYLEILKPDEVLINEGRRNSQLARKVMELYDVNPNSMDIPIIEDNRRQRKRRNRRGSRDDDDAESETGEDRYGPLKTSTVVKLISRLCFDQTKGAELLKRIAREETYEATVVEEYILLSSANAVLHYFQQCLGASFTKNSLHLSINSGGNNRMMIDRSSILQLELLVNSKTGKVKDSLIGTIDCTKTTVGSRLLRTNLMSPPTRMDTVLARLELVDLFMFSEDFFYDVLEHLSKLPDVDKMLSTVALMPRSTNMNVKNSSRVVNQRTASKGISSLVYIKSTLQALPSFAGILQRHLQEIENHEGYDVHDDATVVTDRSSLLVGLGGGNPTRLIRHHLLRAIIFAMTQPDLSIVLSAVTDIFTETTTFSRNANAMKHQECFAFKCDDDCMMSVLRKAFLANVDDIYKKADEYAEVYGTNVAIRYTSSRGYFLAVPADLGTDLPQVFLQPARSGRFINCTTEEIISLNARAQDNVQDLLLMTHDRIQEVLNIARVHYDALATLCDSVALLDMCHSFADNVTQNSLPWCRPLVTEHSVLSRESRSDKSTANSILSGANATMMIRSGRYPIDVAGSMRVDDAEGQSGHIPNDTYATGEKSLTIISGINGSGKSTYLKQIAIITILAHCGTYVPAEQATIPMRDRLCCRIGNADDQEHNISTFMLEMKETAFICNSATERSLVLVDELGRATSNEDGVAIAWSMSEYLLKKRSMTFFVTHYPQLSCLANIYPSVQNVHLEASVTRGRNGDISYTHKVKPGACSISTDYGVELAAACGWPTEVVEDARGIQETVESLLPDDSLCHPRQSMDHVSNDRTKAYEILEIMGEKLLSFVTDESAQTFESIRSALHSLQENLVPSSNDNLLRGMDLLLFRESSIDSHRNWTTARSSYCRDNAVDGQLEESEQNHIENSCILEFPDTESDNENNMAVDDNGDTNEMTEFQSPRQENGHVQAIAKNSVLQPDDSSSDDSSDLSSSSSDDESSTDEDDDNSSISAEE